MSFPLPHFDWGLKGKARMETFYTHVTGNTLDYHLAFVRQLKEAGATEVNPPAKSDITIVFCPIVSRAGTDIDAALSEISGFKQVILVVMHHTHDPELTVIDSSRLVSSSDVILTVDCLYHESKGLFECSRNKDAVSEVLKKMDLPKKGVSKRMALTWKSQTTKTRNQTTEERCKLLEKQLEEKIQELEMTEKKLKLTEKKLKDRNQEVEENNKIKQDIDRLNKKLNDDIDKKNSLLEVQDKKIKVLNTELETLRKQISATTTVGGASNCSASLSMMEAEEQGSESETVDKKESVNKRQKILENFGTHSPAPLRDSPSP